MLTTLMAFRRAARLIFQKYQTAIGFVFKFIISFAAYSRIVAELPYNDSLDKFWIKLIFGIIGALVPQIITIALLVIVSLYEIFSVSPIMALLVFVMLLVLYCFAARFSGKFAYVVIAIPLLMRFNLHYMIALLLGMTATPTAIFPAMVGIMSYYVFAAARSAMVGSEVSSMDDILALYIKYIDCVFENKEMFFVMLIFAFVIVIMWALRQIKFSYSFELTIFAGGAMMVILHAVLAGFMSIRLSYVILGTMLSMLCVYIVQFFRMVLDYSAVESVQFEDDDYYYYVKAVPKLDRVVLGELKPTEADELTESENTEKTEKTEKSDESVTKNGTGENSKPKAGSVDTETHESDSESKRGNANTDANSENETIPGKIIKKLQIDKILSHMKALKKTHIQEIAEQSEKEKSGKSVLDDDDEEWENDTKDTKNNK